MLVTRWMNLMVLMGHMLGVLENAITVNLCTSYQLYELLVVHVQARIYWKVKTIAKCINYMQ